MDLANADERALVLRALDKCLDTATPFFAVRTIGGELMFSAMPGATRELLRTEPQCGFFAGEFFAPWSRNLWLPMGISAQEILDLDLPRREIPDAKIPSDTNRDEYIDSLTRLCAELKTRSHAKSVISIVKSFHRPQQPLSTLFDWLMQNSAGCLAYIFYIPGLGLWMGAPPEVLISTTADGCLRTMALAGTLPIDAPQWDAKNIEEHQIVVDYIKEKISGLGIHPEVGERQSLAYGSIKHLYTPIATQLGQRTVADVYDALNPTPALCGYPKDQALADIDTCEQHRRGCYGGCVGVKYPDGRVQASVNIRCMQIGLNRACFYGGGGITADSIPQAEWEEACSKIGNFRQKLGL